MKYLILKICLVIFPLTQVFAQQVAIPDIEFEKRLISTGVDTTGNLDGFILRSDAEAITGMLNTTATVDGVLTDYTGIEAFINITGLIISNGNDIVTTLDLSNNTKLETVNLNNVIGFDQVDLTANTKLKEIEIIYTRANVTSLNISSLLNLEKLDAVDLDFIDLDLSTNIALKNVLIEDCRNLQILDFSNNTALEKILLTDLNDLIVVNLNNLTGLKELRIENSKNLFEIDFTDASATLTDIDFDYNSSLTTITHGTLPALRNITLKENIELTGALDFSTAIKVDRLILNDNNLTGIDIRNGFNTTILEFRVTQNSNLKCS